MEYYSSLYYITIIASISVGAMVARRQKNASGYYFFLFNLFASSWFLGYFLFFSNLLPEYLLLFISRCTFFVGILGVYSLLFFIVFFHRKKVPIHHHIVIAIFYSFVAVLYSGTDLIIESLSFDEKFHVFRENFGSLFWLEILLYGAFIILFCLFSYRGLYKLTGLYRVRLQHILFATFIFLVVLLFFQLILPIFNIWIFENEVIFLFFSYIAYISLVLRRYYFQPIGYGIKKALLFIISTSLSLFIYHISRVFFPSIGSSEENLSQFLSVYSYIDGIFIILLFFAFYFILEKIFFRRDIDDDFKENILSIQQKLIPIMNVEAFVSTLSLLFKKHFSIAPIQVTLFQDYPELSSFGQYFELGHEENFYINDIVFRVERKGKIPFEEKHIIFEKDIFLILPLMNHGGCFGILGLGYKPFGDFYTKKEIKILINFSYFLAAHIRYIETYTELKEFSRELDRRVDEKTIEYNNLISKQKELISIISHEVRSPLGSAIFQADSIMDDLGDTKKDTEIKRELKVLVDQLITTSDIITKIFSIQYLDITSVSLFRTSVQLSEWLSEIVSVQVRMHEEIDFHVDIDNFGYVSLDKIQFSQVFSNILQNAIKFASIHGPKITVIGRKKGECIIIEFHDNGEGFREEEAGLIFEKFYRGASTPVGLGMGLYLCKKIVEMHEGKIYAHRSEILGGAVMTLEIPVSLRSGTA